MAYVNERPWTADGDTTLRMYLEDGVAIAKIAEDLKRSEGNVRERIRYLLSRGRLQSVDFSKIPDFPG